MPRDRDDDDDDDRLRSIKRHDTGGGIDTVIPWRNGLALGAYYSGIFLGLLCVFGAILGFVPLVLGVLGLVKASKDPEARGRVHAWIGIILGVLEILFGCLVAVAVAINYFGARR